MGRPRAGHGATSARGFRSRAASRCVVAAHVGLALLTTPTALSAQRVEAVAVTRHRMAPATPATEGDAGALLVPPALVATPGTPWRSRSDRSDGPAPWWAPVASALAPGAGQAAAGQDRWIAYAAVEGVALLRYLADHREARREQRSYRLIADRVARALYTTGRPPAGSFEYYETMEKWIASGVYDAVPDGDLQPETDTTTFNGAMWLLARQTYWVRVDEPPLPESDAYRNAVAFYERRAIRAEYRWSWRDAQLQQDLYRRTILRSNAASRRATQDLAAVLANHVLSTVDAYITVRMRRRQGPLGGEMEIEASLPWP